MKILNKIWRKKTFISILSAIVITADEYIYNEEHSFKLGLFFLSFLIFYLFLWGYDNPEAKG